MISFRKSINFKMTGLYLILAIINMSFFTIIIYENQIGLIVENTKNNIIILTNSIVSSLDKISSDNSGKDISTITRESTIKDITDVISRETDSFCIFTEKGELVYRSSEDFDFNQDDILNGIKAVTNKDFTGKRYYSVVDKNSYEISFYIPFVIPTLEQPILFLKFRMDEIGNKLKQLYKLIMIIIFLISLFHVFFAVILYRIFVKPIKYLHDKSMEISHGDLSVRSRIKQDDEIGGLSDAFNSMAQSVEEKVKALEAQYKMIQVELDMASKVQNIIFPSVVNNDRFNFSVYCKPVEKVSGDYYDICELGNSSYGFLIVDVQGHGVPAALITMVIKEKFRLYSPKYSDPSDLIKVINSEIVEIIEGMESALFFTAVYIVIDGQYNIYSVNAAHTCPVLIRKGRKRIEKLKGGGMPIGVSKEMDIMYQTFKTKGESGDKILLYTDGIVEARNLEKEEYGMDGIFSTIKKDYRESADVLLKSLLRDLQRFTDIEDLKDDATLFIIELK